jgi:hypothetical protein
LSNEMKTKSKKNAAMLAITMTISSPMTAKTKKARAYNGASFKLMLLMMVAARMLRSWWDVILVLESRSVRCQSPQYHLEVSKLIIAAALSITPPMDVGSLWICIFCRDQATLSRLASQPSYLVQNTLLYVA